MKDFLIRTTTGIIFVIILIAGIWFSKETFFILFLIILSIGLWEFYSIASLGENKPQTFIGIGTGLLIFIFNFLISVKLIESKFLLMAIPLSVLILISELYRKKENPFINVALTFLGILWVTLPLCLMTKLVFTGIDQIYNPKIVLGILSLMWASDTGAYLFGVTLGKHRLFERISPKKSWEGSIGGVIVTLGVAYIISLFFTDLTTVNWLVIGLIVVVIGTYGDLVESLFKRSMNIKDSGKILPGHGGILDRFDSLLLSVPCIYFYLELIK